jgi:uncharacterized protein YcfJ
MPTPPQGTKEIAMNPSTKHESGLKPFHAIMLAALVSTSLPALAQQGGYRPERSQDEHVTYGYAQVMRVDPVYRLVSDGRSGPRCDRRHRGDGGDPRGGAVLGAIIGGALGNQAGKGDGRKAATVAGAVIGGTIGYQVDKNNGSDPQRRVECTASGYYETRELMGYDVEYQYKGERYVSRLPYDPGNRMRVRVSVVPEDQAYGSR